MILTKSREMTTRFLKISSNGNNIFLKSWQIKRQEDFKKSRQIATRFLKRQQIFLKISSNGNKILKISSDGNKIFKSKLRFPYLKLVPIFETGSHIWNCNSFYFARGKSLLDS